MRRSLAVALVTLFLVRPAAAYYVTPMPVYVPPSQVNVIIPTQLVFNNQFYDMSVGGLDDLCEDFPDLCKEPALQEGLASLNTQRTVGWVLYGVGLAAIIGGTIAILAAPEHTCTDQFTGEPYECGHDVSWPLFIGLEVGGAAVATAGFIVTPSQHQVTRFVNHLNATNPDNPVEMRIGMVTRRSPGVTLAMNF